MARPFLDFIEALREKDDALYQKLKYLSSSAFWREWKQIYPEDFPEGGQSPPSRRSIMPNQ